MTRRISYIPNWAVLVSSTILAQNTSAEYYTIFIIDFISTV